MVIGTDLDISLLTMDFLLYYGPITGNCINTMEKLLLDLKKTVKDFNRDNEGK